MLCSKKETKIKCVTKNRLISDLPPLRLPKLVCSVAYSDGGCLHVGLYGVNHLALRRDIKVGM